MSNIKSPTEKQIQFADEIAYMLGIDFPTGSPDFNRFSYWQFISSHIYEYQCIRNEDPSYDGEMDWFDPFAEGGY